MRSGDRVINEIRNKIDAIGDQREKERLRSELESESASFRSLAQSRIWGIPDHEIEESFRSFRQKVISTQMDEQMSRSLCDEFKKLESSLSSKIHSSFISDWNDIQNEMKRTNSLALQEKIKSLTALLDRTRTFAEITAHAANIYSEFQKFESALSGKMPQGFTPEWNDIQNELQKVKSLALHDKIKTLTALLGRTRTFAEKAAYAANISLTGLVEEKYKIPVRVISLENKSNVKSEKIESLIADIVDFGTRVAFFDEDEAQRLRPLIDEVASQKTHADEFRLSAIRQEVKMCYGKLKERKVLTEVFKEELHDMLPLMKLAQGTNAKNLLVRMEDLLTARDVSRDEFTSLYEDVKILLAEQMESIIDETVTKQVGEALNEMGYTLVGEDGEDLPGLSAQQVNFIESPYEGYQVKVKVDNGGRLSTRLVRVADSEEEKDSSGEYQRQKDIEVGKKWCKDIEKVHEKMKDEGFEFKTTFRKEPEEQPIDVVVIAGVSGRKKARGAKTKISTQASQAQRRI